MKLIQLKPGEVVPVKMNGDIAVYMGDRFNPETKSKGPAFLALDPHDTDVQVRREVKRHQREEREIKRRRRAERHVAECAARNAVQVKMNAVQVKMNAVQVKMNANLETQIRQLHRQLDAERQRISST